jgi:hypothetical protein
MAACAISGLRGKKVPRSQHQAELVAGRLNLTFQFSPVPAGTGVAPNAFAGCSMLPGRPVMPRYFFNVYHDQVLIDDEGEELPDKHTAWKEAAVTTGQMLQRMDGRLLPGTEWRLEVTDEFANPLYVIHVICREAKLT